MPIPFTCPHCGHATQVAEQYAGNSGPCANCGQAITVPAIQDQGDEAVRASSMSMGFTAVVGSLIIAMCAGGFVAMVIPQVRENQIVTKRFLCENKLRDLAIAMHNYHDSYGVFPRAEGEDRDAPPHRSWRVAILPFLGEQHWYDQYDFNEPWDSDNNLRVAASVPPELFQCPAGELHYKNVKGYLIPTTDYVMITGENTVGDGCGMADITDGTSNTLMIVEIAGPNRPAWSEPVDLPIEYIKNGVNNEFGQPSIGSPHRDGANCALCDGSAQFLPDTTDATTLQRLADRQDGAPVTLPTP